MTGKVNINIGVIGFGYWGPNLVRNFNLPGRSRVVAVCDIESSKLARAAERHPGVQTTSNVGEMLTNPNLDAIAIATPVRTHFSLAEAALRAGKHVWLEKPMTETVDQARRLIELAGRQNLVLMVDHTFIYTPAVQRIRELIRSGDLGQIYYYDSLRINLGLFQHDVNVLWDLAVHDLSILDFVLEARPMAVSAVGISHVPGAPENVAYLSVFLAGGTVAHINVNWLAPVKVRRTLIGGSRKMIIFDELEPSEKLKVYDRGITLADDPEALYQTLINYRMGDMWAPNIPYKEALQSAAENFLASIERRDRPLADGEMGLRLVLALELATKSMHQQGVPIAFPGHE
jgi:predicted dehydrogenase